MEKTNYPVIEKESGGFLQLFLKFIPFWPLFLVLTIISVSYFYVKLKYTIPVYESSASVLIKDEKKGQEDSKMEEVLNVFGTKKIVENEQEILRSNSVITDVVKALKLYAPIYEEKGWRAMATTSAYVTSPIAIEAENPDLITYTPKVYFTFSAESQKVFIDGKSYPLDQWVHLPIGVVKFSRNPNYSPPDPNKKIDSKFYFVLTSVNNVTMSTIGSLMVTPSSKQSSIINLSIKDPVPQRAEKVISEIITAYNNASIKRKNEVAFQTLKFIENRLKHVSEELDSLENGIQKFRDTKGVVDIGEQSKIYLESISSNDNQVNLLNIKLSALEEVEKYVTNKNVQSSIVPSTFNIEDPTLTKLLDKLATAEAQYEKLKSTNGENSPIMLSLKEEINKTRPAILENIQSQKKIIESGRNNLLGTSQKYSSMLSSIPKKEKELVDVSRQRNIKNEIYSFLLQKREETSYSISSILPDCYLVSSPTTSPVPVSPKKPFIMLLSLVIPFAIGVLFVLIKDMFNNKILYRTEIENLVPYPIVGEIIYEKLNKKIVTENSERSFIVEQFRQIRAALKHQGTPPGNQKRILITSCIKSDGKSFVAANLAMSLARSGKKIALLELDLHQPKLSELFEIGKCKGITDYLTGNLLLENIVKPSDKHENLFLVPSGSLADDPSELLVNGRLEILLNYLDKQFDVLVIDTAPFKALTDAFVIAANCDLVLMVIRHNNTPKKLVERLADDMEAHNINKIAIIFNGIKKRGMSKYGYGYGYGYGYDQKSAYNEYQKKIKKVS